MKPSGKRTLIILIVALLILVFLISIPGKRSITDTVREQSGHDYIRLSQGWTEYETAGPENAAAIILIHGLSVPMYDWDRQFQFLVDRGYRVIRYNQYGRALSDRPGIKYDRSLYIQQLNELMNALEIQEATLIGHSMGGLITTAYAVEYPERVSRQILIAPALYMAENNSGVTLVKIPILGDLMSATVLPGILTKRAEVLINRSGISQKDVYIDAFRNQTKYRGFAGSVKSLFRNDMVDDFSDIYADLKGNRTLLIWGSDDNSVPAEHTDRIISLLPGIETSLLDGCGHMPNMEEPDIVNELIINFLEK